MKRPATGDGPRCSFCHKSQDVVERLVSSPSDYPRAYICDECIGVCYSILADENPAMHPAQLKPSPMQKIPVIQTLEIPPEYAFQATEVYIRRDPETGDIILSQSPAPGIPQDLLIDPKKNEEPLR